MPRIIDWSSVAAPRELARHVARSLSAGWLIALPTDTAYVLAAWSRSVPAVSRLRELSPARPELAVPGAAAARDWARLNAPARRLARAWPGPLTLSCAEGLAEGLGSCLPPDAREAACAGGELHLRAPGHEAPLEVLRWLPGPLLLAPIAANGAEATTAQQVIAALGDRVELVLDDGPARLRHQSTVVRIAGEGWTVARAGALDEGQLRQLLARRVVFVCTGNTCRSPLAEAICKQQLAARLGCPVEELPARGYLVQSAGLAAGTGMPAAEEAVLVAEALGAADLRDHQSQPLTPELLRAADLILAMTHGHLAALRPHGEGKA
jgi:protein-tyrosine phosphatase